MRLGKARDGNTRAERQRFERRQLDRGTREDQGPQRHHLVRRRRAGRRQRVGGEPADIAVGGKLPPGPAFVIRFVDRDAFALERLGQERRVVAGLAAQRRLRLDYFVDLASDVARRRHFAFEFFRREIGAGRGDARIEGAHRRGPLSRSARQAAHRAHAPPGIRRLPAGPASPQASRQRCRCAATRWPPRQNA